MESSSLDASRMNLMPMLSSSHSTGYVFRPHTTLLSNIKPTTTRSSICQHHLDHMSNTVVRNRAPACYMEPKEVANLHPSIVVEYLPGACYALLLNYKPQRRSFDQQELYLWIVVDMLAGASSLCRTLKQ
jgi:hypothetical protein